MKKILQAATFLLVVLAVGQTVHQALSHDSLTQTQKGDNGGKEREGPTP